MAPKLIILALVVAAPLSACDSGGGHGTNHDGNDGPVSDAGTGDDAPSGDGGPLQIKATIDRCPVVLPVASPSSAKLGGSITLTTMVVDPDADGLTFLWSAPSGSFAKPSAANTEYVCQKVGAPILTIAVSDGQCLVETALPVNCQ